jgi:hypothetical protein
MAVGQRLALYRRGHPCPGPIHRPGAAHDAGPKPPSNGMAEAFVKTFKRDYARVSAKPDAASVLRQLDTWFEHYTKCIRTKRWATARRASSGNRRLRKRSSKRSALCVDRMTAQRPRRRSGQGRSRRRRWRAATALTRAPPWTTPNNYSLSGHSGATSAVVQNETGNAVHRLV